MNAGKRAIMSPVVGIVIALALVWGIGADLPVWRVLLMVIVGAGVAFGLNLAWESNPWTDKPPMKEQDEAAAR